MTEKRYYVREQIVDAATGSAAVGAKARMVWFIRDRLYNCKDVVRIERHGEAGRAVTRGRANGLCIRMNKEYEEWLQHSA